MILAAKKMIPVRTMLLMVIMACASTGDRLSAQTNVPGSANSVPGPAGTPNPAPTIQGSIVNYVRTWLPQQPFTTQASVTSGATVQQVHMTTQYMDALARPLETVSWQLSPGQTDMVAPVDYQPAANKPVTGIPEFKYLPYTSPGNDGSFKSNPFAEQNTFYNSTYLSDEPAYRNEQCYYSHTDYEPSPLNRVSKSFFPGNSWAGSEGSTTERGMRKLYLLNNSNDQVHLWLIASNPLSYSNNDVTTNIPSTSGFYTISTLYKIVSLDEQGNAVVEYKDFDGHVVLKKVQNGTIASDYSGYSGFLCTYFVYDDIGNLRYVITPKAVAEMVTAGSFTLNTSMINELSERYEYDNLQRVIASKSPGSGWAYTVYDKRDRVVFTQDANMRQNNQWMTALYDGLDRPVQTGMLTYSGLPSALQTYVTANTGNYASSAQNVSGTSTEPSVTANLFVSNRVAGQTLYQASNEILFAPGFTSETGASFTAQIVSPTPMMFTNNVTVNDNPIPSGNTFTPLTVTNFDNYTNTTKTYDNSHNGSLDAGSNSYADPLQATGTAMTRGLITSKKVRVIENPANLAQGTWLETANFYDDKGRLIQAQRGNYKGGLDVTTNLYNFYDRVLCMFDVYNYPAAKVNLFSIKTNFNYDQAGRLLNVKKNLNNDQNATSPSTTQRTIATYVYDALGKLKERKIGQQTVSGSAPSTTPLEDQSLAYNIRGWLKGINWNYPSSGPTTSQVNSNTKWFGLDLSFDWGFGTNQFTGSIAGQRWMSGGDGQERSYGFGYDPTTRMMFGDFNQNFGGTWSKTDPSNANFNIDFSEKIGDGQTVSLAYDENGNIRQLQHNGLVINTSSPIDNLSYTYEGSDASNKVRAVTDNAAQPAGVTLGDFVQHTTSADAYGYDVNGNQISDLNRGFNGSIGVDQISGGAITYNYLSLPYQINVSTTGTTSSPKGTITFIYDANGNKLEKRVLEQAAAYNNNTQKQTTDSYLHGFIYENAVLQYFGQEEGRIRPITPSAYNNNSTFAYDYLLEDHLGNVRAVLTDELRQDIYPAATVEAVNPSSIATTDPVYIEQQFYSINNSYISANPPGVPAYQDNNGIPNNNPNCNLTSSPINQNSNSNYMYRINGGAGSNQMGLGLTVRVMAGDKIDIFGKSYYLTNAPTSPTQNTAIVATSLLSSLLGSPSGASLIHGITVPNISQNTAGTMTPLNNFLTPTQVGSTPVAYINYVIFSDQFKYLGSGSSPVAGVGALKDHHTDAQMQSIPIPQNGYIYVYASNESPVDVYFDNLQIVQTRGPLLQTNNFYPAGLLMSGISSMAANELENKLKYTGKELQHQEFSDGTGMEEYDVAARYYDHQLGRWTTPDPAGQFASPYSAMANNWPRFNDPNGKFIFLVPILIAAAIGAATAVTIYSIEAEAGNSFKWKNFWTAAAFGAVGGAISGGASLLGTSLGTLGQSFAYNILSNVGATVGTDLAFGQHVTLGTLAGGVAGGFLGGGMGNFSGVQGGGVINTIDELAFNSAKGAITGALGGGVEAAIDHKDVGQGVVSGLETGAVGGFSSTAILIATFGPAIVPDQNVQDRIKAVNAYFGISDDYAPVFRRGGIYGLLFPNTGVTWGRNLVVALDNQATQQQVEDTYVHEYIHFKQEVLTGFANQISNGVVEQIHAATSMTYDPYTTRGTNEYDANYWENFFKHP